MHEMLINPLHHVNEARAVQEVPEIAEAGLQVNDLAQLVLTLVGPEHLTGLFKKVDGESCEHGILLLLQAVALELRHVLSLLF